MTSTVSAHAFRPISPHDVEIFRTIVLMVKLKRQAVRDHLMAMVEQDPSNIDAVVSLAILNLLHSVAEEAIVQKDAIQMAVVSLDRLLMADPGYWILHLYRTWLLISFLPFGFSSEEQIAEELDAFMKLQAQANPEPYFVLPYLLGAEFEVGRGDKAKALALLSQADALPKRPVTVLEDLLSRQPAFFDRKLVISGENVLADKVGQLRHTFFPAKRT